MSEQTYMGGELQLFAQATHWKNYWASRLRRYILGSVLEVGAGLGANTFLLRDGAEGRWVCLEPDPRLAAALGDTIAGHLHFRAPEVRLGTLATMDSDEAFDSILYIDVLEHIREDRAELERAAGHVKPGGHLIVLAPAHSWLFSKFDQAIGHFRRYTAASLASLTPSGLCIAASFYLDSVGLIASAANRFLLRQSLPNARQIHWWDNVMVPCSQLLDPLLTHRLGKSVVCVWERKL